MDEVGPVSGPVAPLPPGSAQGRSAAGSASGAHAARLAAARAGVDQVDLSTAAKLGSDPAAAAARAAALVKAMAPGASPVDVGQLAAALKREGVVGG